MRILSRLLIVLAMLVAGGAVVIYGALTNLTCGYAPNASGCQALPWELGSDDRFWLVGVPSGIVVTLVALAALAWRRSYRTGNRRDDR